MSHFTIKQRDPASRARTGLLKLAHGTVQTPAFVPLATKGVVKTLAISDVVALGYEMVLGNTFHLFIRPGHEFVARRGGLHEFMRWSGPIITDSGGFQVFSLGHGSVADEIKGRSGGSTADSTNDREGRSRHADSTNDSVSRSHRKSGVVGIEESGVTFRSYLDGSTKFMAPETSMEVQAALGSDIALVFDECTPFHVSRDYTARSMQRTHRWLDRCLAWHAHNGPREQIVYGIIQGGVYEDLRRESTQAVSARECGGIAIGGCLGRDKDQMFTVVDWVTAELDDRPRHLLGIGEVDDLLRGVELGIDTFDCAMPTRIARHGMALTAHPENRFRVDLTASRWRESDDPIIDGCPCSTCKHGYSRAYINYLLRAKEITALRLLTIHNLHFISELMAGIRAAINHNAFADYRDAVMNGELPWEASRATSFASVLVQ